MVADTQSSARSQASSDDVAESDATRRVARLISWAAANGFAMHPSIHIKASIAEPLAAGSQIDASRKRKRDEVESGSCIGYGFYCRSRHLDSDASSAAIKGVKADDELFALPQAMVLDPRAMVVPEDSPCRGQFVALPQANAAAAASAIVPSSLRADIDRRRELWQAICEQNLEGDVLALALLHEVSLKEASFWWPYSSMLPPDPKRAVDLTDAGISSASSALQASSFDSLPMYWTAEERSILLTGTNIGAELLRREQAWDACSPLDQLRTLCDRHLPRAAKVQDELGWLRQLRGRPRVKKDAFLWAKAVIESRSFPSWLVYGEAHRTDGTAYPILLPVIDFANHGPRAKIAWHACDTLSTTAGPMQTGRAVENGGSSARPGTSIRFTSGQAYASGSEIFHNYGCKGNDAFLLSYGFVLDDVALDSVSIKLGAEQWASIQTSGPAQHATYEITYDQPVNEQLLERFIAVATLRAREHDSDGTKGTPTMDSPGDVPLAILAEAHIDLCASLQRALAQREAGLAQMHRAAAAHDPNLATSEKYRMAESYSTLPIQILKRAIERTRLHFVYALQSRLTGSGLAGGVRTLGELLTSGACPTLAEVAFPEDGGWHNLRLDRQGSAEQA